MHPLQRSWDALLILYWRKDQTMGALAAQCEHMLGKTKSQLAEEGVLRCSAYSLPKMLVRSWVALHLKPLNEKLWDVADNKRVLDWTNASTGLDCALDKKTRQKDAEVYALTRRDRLHIKQNRLSIEIGKLGNRGRSPNMVKAVRSKR